MSAWPDTELTDHLGIRYPIIQAPMASASTPALAIAVSTAGGLGSLGGFIIPWLTGRLASEVGLPLAFAGLAGWLILLAIAAAAAAPRFRRLH